MGDCRTSDGWNSFELRKINAIIFANIIGCMFESLNRDELLLCYSLGTKLKLMLNP